jgi:hypothetical protein
MVTVLRMYRFKTQRLVRTFFDDIASRLQARKLMKPYSDQLKELRSKLKTNDGDFTFLPPLQYPHKVCNKHFFFATVFPTLDFPSLLISLCMYFHQLQETIKNAKHLQPHEERPEPIEVDGEGGGTDVEAAVEATRPSQPQLPEQPATQQGDQGADFPPRPEVTQTCSTCGGPRRIKMPNSDRQITTKGHTRGSCSVMGINLELPRPLKKQRRR